MTKPKQPTTPYFPDFHLPTLRRKPRSAQQILKQEQKESQRKSFAHLNQLLKDFLPKDLFGSASERKRLFTKKNTFFTFLHQCWSEDGSCQEAVHRLREQADAQGMIKLPSASTSAYVQARHRLDLEELRDVFYHGAGTIEMDGEALHGERPWVVVDGTGLSMPDTEENQGIWPQPTNQKPGVGFPNVKVVASLSLHTGAVLDAEFGNKYDHEITLFRKLSDSFQTGDIVIGDRAFDSWHDTVSLLQGGVDTVLRKHSQRKLLKKSEARKVLGEGDLLIASKKSVQAPSHISREDWEKMPSELLVRQITFTADRPGFRPSVITVLTTLIDPIAYPAEKIKAMYLRRWQIEVSLRDIKITMDLDILRCKTPGMIRKEIWMHLIAYNALCYLQVKAAIQSKVERFRLSFKGCLEVIRTWEKRFTQKVSSARNLREKIYESMTSILLPIRPDRVEPRLKKRRPKKVRYITKPRHIYRQEMMPAARW